MENLEKFIKLRDFEEYKKRPDDKYIQRREILLLGENEYKNTEEMYKQINTSLFVEGMLSGYKPLEIMVAKSCNKRYKFALKNKKYILKTLKKRRKFENYSNTKLILGKKLAPFLIKIMKLVTDVKVTTYIEGDKSDESIKVNNHDQIKAFLEPYSDKPLIFIPMHICKYDIEVVYETIRSHLLLLSGTEERMHGTINGFFLNLNGINYVDRSNIIDRKLSFQKMINDLNRGYNIMYFPEGTWNISPEKLMLPISYKIIQLAMKTDAFFVPIAFNYTPQLKNKTISNRISKPYKVNSNNSLTNSLNELVEKCASSKWYLYEMEAIIKRDDLTAVHWDNKINAYYNCFNQNAVSILNEFDKHNYFDNKTWIKLKKNLKSKLSASEIIMLKNLLENKYKSINYWKEMLTKLIGEWPATDLIEESAYSYQPKGDAYEFFETWNTSISYRNGQRMVKRITSEGRFTV